MIQVLVMKAQMPLQDVEVLLTDRGRVIGLTAIDRAVSIARDRARAALESSGPARVFVRAGRAVNPEGALMLRRMN